MSVENRKRAFTLVELVFVVLILGLLAAVAIPRIVVHSQDTEIATVQISLRTIQDVIDQQHASTGEYPLTIKPEWFRGNKLPHHPLNDGSIPDVHIFASDDRTHPAYKIADKWGAYWYNRNIGVVRARVPRGESDAETLKFYNQLNGSRLTDIGQRYD